MTPGSKRERARFLRASAEYKGAQLRDAIGQLAAELDRQADQQERSESSGRIPSEIAPVPVQLSVSHED